MTTPTTEGVTPAMIEAGKDAYTRWQQNSEPTEQSLGEAIYLAMDAARSTDPSVAKMREALENIRDESNYIEVRGCDPKMARILKIADEALSSTGDVGVSATAICDACSGSGFGVADTYCGKCGGCGGIPMDAVSPPLKEPDNG